MESPLSICFSIPDSCQSDVIESYFIATTNWIILVRCLAVVRNTISVFQQKEYIQVIDFYDKLVLQYIYFLLLGIKCLLNKSVIGLNLKQGIHHLRKISITIAYWSFLQKLILKFIFFSKILLLLLSYSYNRSQTERNKPYHS